MSALANKVKSCFQLKADFFPITVFKITHFDLNLISEQLKSTIQSAPKYFQQAPMIIDVKDIHNEPTFELDVIYNLLRTQNIIPIGIRGLDKNQSELAQKHNLAIINDSKAKQAIKTTVNKKEPIKKTSLSPNKVITKPVRSGTCVYAKGGDLIILAAVNAGGECIADGNIHVYGPLRGRALAGANGNTSARIFCKKLEADLVSIAGHYLTSEEIKTPKNIRSMLQIYLQNGSLIIDNI